MTDRELMQQALDALEKSAHWVEPKVMQALRARLAQQNDFNPYWDVIVEMLEEQLRMETRIEELETQLAQHEPEKSLSQRMRKAKFTPRDTRLECDGCGKKFSRLMLPIHDCEEAQPEPPCKTGSQCIGGKCDRCAEPKPVAVWELQEDGWYFIADRDWIQTLPIGTKLYAAPPRREWQSLTGEEVRQITGVSSSDSDWSVMAAMKWVKAAEEKLKEKNNA